MFVSEWDINEAVKVGTLKIHLCPMKIGKYKYPRTTPYTMPCRCRKYTKLSLYCFELYVHKIKGVLVLAPHVIYLYMRFNSVWVYIEAANLYQFVRTKRVYTTFIVVSVPLFMAAQSSHSIKVNTTDVQSAVSVSEVRDERNWNYKKFSFAIQNSTHTLFLFAHSISW